jgi:hypothetical protein
MAKYLVPLIVLSATLFATESVRADSFTFNDLTHTLSNTSLVDTAFTINWSNGTTDSLKVCSSALGGPLPCTTNPTNIFTTSLTPGRSAPSALNCVTGAGFYACSVSIFAPAGGATVASATAGNGSAVSLGVGGDLLISGLGNEASMIADEVQVNFLGGLPTSYTVNFISRDDSPTPVNCNGQCAAPSPVPEPSVLQDLAVGLLMIAAGFCYKLRFVNGARS